ADDWAEIGQCVAEEFDVDGQIWVVADEQKVKYWKALLVFLGEAGLLFAGFTFFVPYTAIILLGAAMVALGVMLLRKRVSRGAETDGLAGSRAPSSEQ
ncbi:MAG: hypothetical protein AAB731_04195, partial [Patescibacteria group bacterium]